MKTYEYADAASYPRGLERLLNADGLYAPTGGVIFPGHSDWAQYSSDRIISGCRAGIMARADREPCGLTVFEPESLDAGIIGLKYVWVSSAERRRGVGDALVSLTLGGIGARWPNAKIVTGYAKTANHAIAALALRHGFLPSAPLLRPSPYGHNGELDTVYTKLL